MSKSTSSSASSVSDSSYESIENQFYDIEEIPEIPKKHPNIFNMIVFGRSFPQIVKGRKGSLHVQDIGQLPSTMKIEQSFDELKEEWDNQLKKDAPSLIKAILKKEWKWLLFSFIVLNIGQIAMMIFPLMIQFIIDWMSDPQSENYIGFIYTVIIFISQNIDSYSYQFSCKWIFILSIRLRN